MKKISMLMVFALIALVLFSGCVSTKGAGVNEKPVILIAAFGSSYESGQANLNDFDKAVMEAFPGHDVRWGFTASFIVNKLREEGVDEVFDRKVKVQTLDEALDGLREDGIRNVVIQSLHLMVGAEFRQVMAADTSGLNVKYSYPLLFHSENIQNAVAALEQEIADSDEIATVFCAHGNEAHPEYNAELEQLDSYLRDNYKNTYVAVMEGNPEFGPVKDTILANGTEKVKFVTFMLTYGDHMSNDVMGDEEDSMKTQIGLPAECCNGLASLQPVQDIFIISIKAAVGKFI